MAYDEAIGVAAVRFVGVGAHAAPPLPPPPVATSHQVDTADASEAAFWFNTPPDQ